MNRPDFEGLSKREKKELKKKLRQEKTDKEEKNLSRRKTGKKIIKIGIGVLVLGLIALFLIQGIIDNSPDPRGSGLITISSEVHDFGTVSIRKGTVSTSMEIINKGKGKLVLNGLKSSCMCTTAVIIINGIQSPVFGMHNNPGYKQILEPGEEAQLKIFYDPTAHPDLRGPVTRIVSIYSDDPLNSEKKVKINVNQVA